MAARAGVPVVATRRGRARRAGSPHTTRRSSCCRTPARRDGIAAPLRGSGRPEVPNSPSASGARWLLSRDDALLKLARRMRRDFGVEILSPRELGCDAGQDVVIPACAGMTGQASRARSGSSASPATARRRATEAVAQQLGRSSAIGPAGRTAAAVHHVQIGQRRELVAVADLEAEVAHAEIVDGSSVAIARRSASTRYACRSSASRPIACSFTRSSCLLRHGPVEAGVELRLRSSKLPIRLSRCHTSQFGVRSSKQPRYTLKASLMK